MVHVLNGAVVRTSTPELPAAPADDTLARRIAALAYAWTAATANEHTGTRAIDDGAVRAALAALLAAQR